MKKRLLTIAAAVLGLSAGSALAAIPSTAPYNTDTSSEYVMDQSSRGIDNLNMVMCIVHGLNGAGMLDLQTATSSGKSVTYRALVDMNKCDPRSRSSTSNSSGGSSGGTSAPNYINAVVKVSRVDSSHPMIGEVWMHFSQDFGSGVQAATVYAHLSATQPPNSTLPYGAFRLDYTGILDASGNGAFQGFIDSSSATLQYFENGTYGSGTALTMAASSTSAASGIMQIAANAGNGNTAQTFDFAYNSNYFLRDVNSGAQYCFDRSKANANKAVWRYGTYDASTGDRVDLANPGFPIAVSSGNSTYYGFAGYWGINFQGLDLNSMTDAAIAALTVNDQRPNNSSTYTLHRVAGRLTKWTKQSVTLSNLDGIPFTAWVDLTGNVTGNTTQVTGNNNWQMQWDSSANSGNGGFVVTGEEACNNGPCVLTTFPTTATVIPGTFANQPIYGWSEAYGGNITIPANGSPHTDTTAATDAANYYTQDTVIPGSSGAPTNLYCLNNCPTASALSAFDGTSATSPYGNGTDGQWFSASSSSNTVSYTFGASGLEESTTPMVYTGSLSDQWQWGVMSGRLFDTGLSNTNCPSGAPSGTLCEPQDPTTYYTWQTGPDQWSQSLWLVDNSSSNVVTFDPPENVSYTVPSNSSATDWAGKTVMLQFDGFGNLDGIPGQCVNPVDNATESCDQSGALYVPAFAVADGTTFTLPNNSQIIVKALDVALQLKNVSTTTCSNNGLSLGSSATLPTSTDLNDPTNSANSDYIGSEPTVSGPPSVIDGVIQ